MSLVIAALVPLIQVSAVAAEPASEAQAQQIPTLTHAEAVAELKRLQSEQDNVKQLASSASGNVKLGDLHDTLKQLDDDVDALTAALTPQRAQLQAQVDLLGPPPEAATAGAATPARPRARPPRRKPPPW